MNIEEELHKIHETLLQMYPTATSVKIFVNSEGIQAIPVYRTDATGYSMKNINGGWIKKSTEGLK